MIRGQPERGSRSAWLPALSLPPRDEAVLCALLDRAEEFEWLSRTQIYALRLLADAGAIRADAGELRAEWALFSSKTEPPTLWAREGAWFVQTREDLLDSGYPEPVADAYLCATFRPVHVVAQWLADLDFDGLWDLATDSGDKFLVTTWAELLDRGDVTSISRY